MARDELFSAPSDLTLMSVADLTALQEQGMAEVNRLNSEDPGEVTAESAQQRIAYAGKVADDLDRIAAELEGKQATASRLAEQARIRNADQMAAIAARVNGPVAPAEPAAPVAAAVDTDAIARATAQGVTAALADMMGSRFQGQVTRATASLSATAAVAPQTQGEVTPRLAVTASIDIPGKAAGADIVSMDDLGDAFSKKSRAIPISRTGSTEQGHIVATIKNQFEHTVDNNTSFSKVGQLIKHLTRPEMAEALVAGGGWCAPSEIRYDFFNIACSDGLIDLPTVGITRGGIQFPVSPSLADAVGSNAFGGFAVTFSNASVPWLWTEADDEATVTGSPNKPCMRVPCPTFDEERLDCYGICLTAGNLTNDAYPEATQNTLQLLMAAHERAINARLIALMVAASGAATAITGGAATDAAAPRIYDAVSLAATDYRARYGMCTDDVLEVVLPYWVRDVLRADLAWKAGVDAWQAVADAEITSFFTARNVRVQWVSDWQVRGSGQFGNATGLVAWPTTVNFMIFAAGTFLHGQGMTLDLGVIRDSVLNAENDYTAAWSEECHLIAMVGHASRQYSVGFNVNGSTSALLTGTVRV
jgi:hypothetical protein